MEVVGPLLVLDPLVGLTLRVNHQRPPTGIAGEVGGWESLRNNCRTLHYTYVCLCTRADLEIRTTSYCAHMLHRLHRLWCPPDDDAIVNRKAVGGQPSNVPFTYLHRVPKCGTEGELTGARDAHPAALLTPLIDLIL